MDRKEQALQLMPYPRVYLPNGRKETQKIIADRIQKNGGIPIWLLIQLLQRRRCYEDAEDMLWQKQRDHLCVNGYVREIWKEHFDNNNMRYPVYLIKMMFKFYHSLC